MDKKFLIITPKNGLCNQLSSISKGIILGLLSNRNVIFTSFQLDYKNIDNICPFNSVINLNNLQKVLDEQNVDIKLFSDLGIKGERIKIDTNEDIPHIKDFIKYLFIDDNKNIIYLDVDCPISFDVPNEYINLYNYINLNIKFTEKYIKIAELLKEQLKLQFYSCIHLRLEDDSINFMKELNEHISIDKINEIYINKYIEEFDILKNISNNQKIYVCTSLSMNNNMNNDFYTELKKTYNIVDKNDIIKINENNCREIYGIIDFIIAQDSLYFVGSDWSSFSIYLYSLHKHNKKDAKLINIWETLQNIKF